MTRALNFRTIYFPVRSKQLSPMYFGAQRAMRKAPASSFASLHVSGINHHFNRRDIEHLPVTNCVLQLI